MYLENEDEYSQVLSDLGEREVVYSSHRKKYRTVHRIGQVEHVTQVKDRQHPELDLDIFSCNCL